MGHCDRAQSAPLGVLLLVVVTMLGATMLVSLGSAGLSDVRESSQLQRAEGSLSLLDAQATQVALGRSNAERVDFGSGDGTYSVDPTAGEISIVQLDCDDDGTNDDGDDVGGGGDGVALSTDDDAYILPPTDLGAVTYDAGDETLAYQGGGVWRESGSGSVEMLSPPSAHYRGSTLTFPVVLTRGTGGASGAVTAQVTAPTDPTTVFARPTADFPDRCWEDGTAEPLANPVTDGRVVVRIESEYAQAWGRYFERRTAGTVSYPAADAVQIELGAASTDGTFGLPGDGGAVTVAGTDGSHAVERFELRLRPDDPDATTFDDLQWSLSAESGAQRFELHLERSGSGGCPSTGITADATVYYSADDGNTYQGWHLDDAFDAECADLNGDGDDEIYMDVDFVDDEDGDGDDTEIESDDPEFAYTSLGADATAYFDSDGTLVSNPTFSGHGDWESESYTTGDTESVDRLVNHYFAELPEEFDLTVDDKGSDTVAETASSVTVSVAGSGRTVTYLHVVEREVVVELEA